MFINLRLFFFLQKNKISVFNNNDKKIIIMLPKMRTRTPSPKTVTFDPSPPTTLNRSYRRRFKNHVEWEQYLSKLINPNKKVKKMNIPNL